MNGAPAAAKVDAVEALRLSIVRLERKLRKHSGAEATPSQLSMLTALQRHGPMRPAELAAWEQISRPTATGLIARLEDKGLLGRAVDPADARSHLLRLTDSGESLLRDAAARSSDYLRTRIGDLSTADRAALMGAIEALQRLSGPPR